MINLGLLMLASLFISVARAWVMRVHAKMFRLSESELPGAYFQYLAHYKLAILMFNLTPYFALKLMS